jgi:hypothetical protein
VAWLPGEPWAAARALRSSPLRAEAIVLALQDTSAPDAAARVERAEQIVAEDMAAAALEPAAVVAARLDALEGTPPALRRHSECLVRLGRNDAARALLTARLESADDAGLEAQIHLGLARVALAGGDVPGARHEFGAALALGEAEAAAGLAGLDWEAGAVASARALARAWLDDPAPAGPGAALWGLTLLPVRAPSPAPAPLR